LAEFLFALVAVFVTSLGGRDQLLAARLAERLGKGGGLLAVGVLASTLSAFAMAIAGLALALMLPGPAADMLVAMGLLLAAAELAWPRRAVLPEEPTRSLFATFIVLAARQIGDGARFLVFAFAAGGSAWLAGAGGAIGGSAAIALGVAASGELPRWPLRWVRIGLAVLLAVTGIVVGLKARGIIA
jgi:putative Ca2+/H+ antiporter (TMEM165/GDT1 family)